MEVNTYIKSAKTTVINLRILYPIWTILAIVSLMVIPSTYSI